MLVEMCFIAWMFFGGLMVWLFGCVGDAVRTQVEASQLDIYTNFPSTSRLQKGDGDDGIAAYPFGILLPKQYLRGKRRDCIYISTSLHPTQADCMYIGMSAQPVADRISRLGPRTTSYYYYLLNNTYSDDVRPCHVWIRRLTFG
jgi:hypothetical protein